MAERRSLGAALELSPEKLAFISGGPVVAAKAAPMVAKPELTKAQDPEEINEEPQVQSYVRSEQPVRRSRTRRQVRAPMPQGDDHLLGIANLLMPLTTRLQPVTAAALKRTGLEQKLRGQSPGTVQEIAEEAIQHWLRDAGHLE